MSGEPQLSEDDAGMLRQRLHVVLATLVSVVVLAIALNGKSGLPMPSVVGLGLIAWLACGLFMLGRELSWQTVALPLVTQVAVAAFAFFVPGFWELIDNIERMVSFVLFFGVFGAVQFAIHMGWIPKDSDSGGSSGCSSCSSCGGGGCGSGCSGCGG